MSLLINRTHKWVYIHIPKTGGSSISHILNTVEGTESISTHGSILEVKDNISDYFEENNLLDTLFDSGYGEWETGTNDKGEKVVCDFKPF